MDSNFWGPGKKIGVIHTKEYVCLRVYYGEYHVEPEPLLHVDCGEYRRGLVSLRRDATGKRKVLGNLTAADLRKVEEMLAEPGVFDTLLGYWNTEVAV